MDDRISASEFKHYMAAKKDKCDKRYVRNATRKCDSERCRYQIAIVLLEKKTTVLAL